jgi:hypothetical protein
LFAMDVIGSAVDTWATVALAIGMLGLSPTP